jgi:Iodothyronine deiodinase/EF hand
VNCHAIRTLCAATLFCAALFCGSLVADDQTDSADPDSKPVATKEQLTPEAQQIADHLLATLPEDSEARAMLDQILEGSRLGPGEGWFAMAVAQTRFGWDYVSQHYDTDGNGQVRVEEFTGPKNDFTRLDRDGDGSLTPADLDWSEHSLTMTPGRMLFYQADADSNGKLTPAEFEKLFDRLDTDGRGFLAIDDVYDQFQPPADDERRRQRDDRPDRPSRSTLVLGLQRQEIGSLQPGPALNDEAPDFTLKSLKGDEVTLSDQVGQKPVVLIFGNFTCGPFRSHSGNIEKLYDRYRDRADFFLVYVREAHPSDGWWMMSNQRIGIDIAQPQTDDEKRAVAATCQRRLDLDIPFLVDSVDDEVSARYSGMPNRLYLLDTDGRIAFKNGRGPFGFHPRQLEQALVLLLAELETSNSK